MFFPQGSVWLGVHLTGCSLSYSAAWLHGCRKLLGFVMSAEVTEQRSDSRVCTYRRLKVVHCLQSVGQFFPPPCIQIKSLTLRMIQYSYDDGFSCILNVDRTSIFRVHNCCFHLLFLDCGSSICQLENQDFLAFKQYYVSKSSLSFCEYENAGLSRWNWSVDKKETGKASS